MDQGNPMPTLMYPYVVVVFDEVRKPIFEKEYRGMIGSLLYLTSSRPNIVFLV